jgi:hypothetical protein
MVFMNGLGEQNGLDTVKHETTGYQAIVCYFLVWYEVPSPESQSAATYNAPPFLVFTSVLSSKLQSTVQYSTVQYSTADSAERRTAQHSTAQHSTAQHSTAQHSTAQHSTTQ